MNYSLPAALTLAILAFGILPPAVADGPHYSRRELNTLINGAHTQSEFAALAKYYEEQSTIYRGLSAEQERDWRRELGRPTSGSKYPTAADRARHMHEYYEQKAEEVHARFLEYELKAKGPGAKLADPRRQRE